MDEPLNAMGGPYRVNANGKGDLHLLPRLCEEDRCRAAKVSRRAGSTGRESTCFANAENSGSRSSRKRSGSTGCFQSHISRRSRLSLLKRSVPSWTSRLMQWADLTKSTRAGKAIYICCPGCAKKIAAEPQKYLTVLAQQGVNAPVIR